MEYLLIRVLIKELIDDLCKFLFFVQLQINKRWSTRLRLLRDSRLGPNSASLGLITFVGCAEGLLDLSNLAYIAIAATRRHGMIVRGRAGRVLLWCGADIVLWGGFTVAGWLVGLGDVNAARCRCESRCVEGTVYLFNDNWLACVMFLFVVFNLLWLY